ncbi:hypothetical protein [Acinetobacter boissieri]|uniref:Uncharacterized protein n=1 Tax=Acinetobacter boissieri TaxID=1219383 RepID=A0A1G6JN85_9GAMM|nr:hypothetical protein [Acinetobacter boissieri]SDC20200.1 hypothetical protein SAMN05421733_1121 [Acinetobacter boissieri]
MKKSILKTLLLAATLVSAVPSYVQAKQVSSTNQAEKTLSITAEKFRDNFNAHAKEIGAPQLQDIKYQESNGTFMAFLGDDFTFVGKMKNKKLTHVAALLLILPQNKGRKLASQAETLAGIALIMARVLDSNKIDKSRDDAVQQVYDNLLNDPKTIKYENTKTGSYGNFNISASFLPKLSALSVSFEPR